VAEKDEIRELVERAKAYDRGAFGKIYDLYFDRVYKYVYYRIGNQTEAEDIVERVFLRVLETIKSFEWREVPFLAWLFRIASNLVIDRYREQSKMAFLSLDEIMTSPPEAESTETTVIKNLDQARLHHALSKLTEEQKQVIILKFLVGLSNAQIGAFLNKTEGAVKSIQHRALKALQKILRGEIPDESRV